MIHYKIYGDGRPVLIIHGLFGTLDNWKSFSNLMTESYQVIAVDLRNHGRSFWSDDFNYELLANDISELLEHLNIDKIDILGHSMGGKVAMQFANQFPESVSKLVIVDIGYKEYVPSHLEIFDAVLNMRPDQINSRKEADDILRESIPNNSIRMFLLKSLSRNSEGGYKWKTNFRALYNHYPDVLISIDISQIERPILFIKGQHSNYITQEDIQTFESLNENFEIVTLPCGHWVHAELPKELFHQIDTFLT